MAKQWLTSTSYWRAHNTLGSVSPSEITGAICRKIWRHRYHPRVFVLFSTLSLITSCSITGIHWASEKMPRWALIAFQSPFELLSGQTAKVIAGEKEPCHCFAISCPPLDLWGVSGEATLTFISLTSQRTPVLLPEAASGAVSRAKGIRKRYARIASQEARLKRCRHSDPEEVRRHVADCCV